MYVKIYSVLDRKLREFGGLLLERNVDTIQRSLVSGVRGSGSMMERYPDDFDLYEIADFDTETGLVVQRAPVLVDRVAAILEAFSETGGE